MIVTANGKPRDVSPGSTVADLVTQIGWRSEWVVVELNGEPLERARFAGAALAEGDRLEIVRAVAGGAGSGTDLRDRLEAARLYLVCGAVPDAFLDAVLAAGVDVLQLREKQMEARPLLEHAARFRAACDRHGAIFIVNDRADVAAAAGADGVHLGQDDLPPREARAMLGPDALVGRSTHAPEDIGRAHAEPVDYIAVGPVFPTPTKPGRPGVGLDLVRLAFKEASMPWFAIGGISAANVTDVVEAGASRIAVVRAICDATDPGAAASALRAALSL